jgi:hypothetical protein
LVAVLVAVLAPALFAAPGWHTSAGAGSVFAASPSSSPLAAMTGAGVVTPMAADRPGHTAPVPEGIGPSASGPGHAGNPSTCWAGGGASACSRVRHSHPGRAPPV